MTQNLLTQLGERFSAQTMLIVCSLGQMRRKTSRYQRRARIISPILRLAGQFSRLVFMPRTSRGIHEDESYSSRAMDEQYSCEM